MKYNIKSILSGISLSKYYVSIMMHMKFCNEQKSIFSQDSFKVLKQRLAL